MNQVPRRVAVLGSTGSVGRQALEVIARHPEHLRVVGLVAGSDRTGLERQAARYGVARLGLGEEAAEELARAEDVDIVLNAIVGAVGLRASLAALESGKTLALANKESLIVGGPICLAAARRGNGTIVPVDSEHAALAQCLRGRDPGEIRRIVLTASGGPFRTRSDLSGVTPAEALAHPTWSMGPKITVDSATLMNKGFEVIEAHHMFQVRLDRIEVLVHPQSIVHGIVEMSDGSLVMHAAVTDMRIPIQAALVDAPHRWENFGALDLSAVGALDFEPLDRQRFPAVDLAYQSARAGGTYPAVLNAANEVAVDAFLVGRLAFSDITGVVEETLSAHDGSTSPNLDAVLAADEWARVRGAELITERALSVSGGST